MENYQNLINEALGGGTPKECYNNLMDILQERLNNKPAVNHHDELVEALKVARSYFEKYNCGGHTKDYDGKIYMDQGSAYLKTWLALSNLPTQ